MSRIPVTRGTVGLLLLGCFLVAVPGAGFGQPGEKTPAPGSNYTGKAIELKFTDGKGSYTGELTADDPIFQERHYKLFTIQLEKGKVYRIDHRDAGDDPKFDPFLFLEDAAGANLEVDDDSGGKNDARILIKITKTGPYRVIATTAQPKQTSKFKLEISQTTDAGEIKTADIKARVKIFTRLKPAERKTLVAEVTKLLQDRGANLSVSDVQLAFQLGGEAELMDVELARALYGNLGKIVAASPNKQIAGAARVIEGALKSLDTIGKPIEITGKTVDGKDFDLKSLKGKVVLVDFWATWCGPCVAEIPNVKAAYAKYHGKGFEVIGVSLDRKDDAIVKFTASEKLPWACINVEDSRKLAEKYGVNAIPHPVLVGADGNVVSLRARGPILDRLLERLLGEKK